MVRVVIIGYGSIARKHVAALRALEPDAEVFALRSRPDASVEEGITNLHAFGEIAPLAPDFVLLSNPTMLRGELLERLVPLGIPLFIEKPVLASTSTAPALRAQIEKMGTLTYVACNLRFLGSLQFVRNQLERLPSPNEVNVYCGSFLPDWRPGAAWREVYSARPELGGGAHLDLIHELDYLYWLFGAPERASALRRKSSSLNIEAVDYANYRLVYPEFVAGATLNYFRRDYKRELEIVFPDETWTVDLAANTVHDHTGRERFAGDDGIAGTYQHQMAYFLAALAGKYPSFNTFTDGLTVLEIALSDE